MARSDWRVLVGDFITTHDTAYGQHCDPAYVEPITDILAHRPYNVAGDQTSSDHGTTRTLAIRSRDRHCHLCRRRVCPQPSVTAQPGWLGDLVYSDKWGGRVYRITSTL